MNFITHLLAVLVFVKILNLTGIDLILAFVFGILIDIDHLIKLPLYKKNKKKKHLNWRTPLEEPISYLWVIPLSIFIKSYIPVLFFSLHLSLDYMMSYEKKIFFPFSNLTIRDTKKYRRDIIIQIIVSVILCIFLVTLLK